MSNAKWPFNGLFAPLVSDFPVSISTYYEGDVDGADGVTVIQSRARDTFVKVKHFGLIVC